MFFRRILAMLAFVAATCALAAPQAMAATPKVHPVEGGFPVPGHSTFGAVTLSTTSMVITVSCTGGTGTYDVTSETTAERILEFQGCKSSAGSKCFTLGYATGVIRLGPLVSHLVYLDENHTKIGILTTPPLSGVFTAFRCEGGSTIELKGTGMLAEITAPKCGETSKTSTVLAETSVPGTQKYLQVEETGTAYDLNLFGGLATAAISGTETVTSERALTLTCPEQK